MITSAIDKLDTRDFIRIKILECKVNLFGDSRVVFVRRFGKASYVKREASWTSCLADSKLVAIVVRECSMLS